jgi:CRISPR/Cas system Type II protein with McrA/HNH and RuvC-like nuclease domain
MEIFKQFQKLILKFKWSCQTFFNKGLTMKKLSLDTGANTIGWMLLELPDNNTESELPIINSEKETEKTGILSANFLGVAKLLASGVRLFPAGKEAFGSNKEKSLNVDRGNARRTRRRFARFKKRKAKLRQILMEHQLLAANTTNVFEHEHSDPLEIRTRGLDEKLSLYELGRAVYHINERRGFLSVRKTRVKEENKKKEVTASESAEQIDETNSEKKEKTIDILRNIQQLEDAIKQSEKRTLGEYLWSLRCEKGNDFRIRKRHTKRSMYENEFEILWEKQKQFYPNELTDELKKKIKWELWFVRPIYWKQSTIAKCEYEQNEYVAPRADRLVQEFRFFQEINNLKYWDENNQEIRVADNKQWQNKIVAKAKISEKITFDAIRTCIGLNGSDIRFNLETGKKKQVKKGETPSEETVYRKELKAFETDAVMRKEEYFDKKWDSITEEEKNKIVRILIERPKDSESEQFEFDEKGRAKQMQDDEFREYIATNWQSKYGLSDNQVDNLLDKEKLESDLPKGQSSLSRKALRKLLPFLREGKQYSKKDKSGAADDAIHLAGYKRRDELTDWRTWKELPPIKEYLKRERLTLITNPVVRRIISEMRNLINAIIKQHGRPDFIHVELARDAKNSKKKRDEITKQNLANKTAREYAKQKIREAGAVPSDDMVERFRLWTEQGGICPYTSIDQRRDEKRAKEIQQKKNAGKKLSKEDEKWETNYAKRLIPKDAQCAYSAAAISLTQLFGGEVEIDHIVPRSRMGDNTMQNKVVCFRSANEEKGNRTPFEWLGEEGIKAVSARIRNMPMSPAKKVRLTSKTTIDEEEFTRRQMHDTQYASRYVADYLRCLYKPEEYKNAKGKIHPRVVTVKGGITAFLRNQYGLNEILHESDFKSEDLLNIECCQRTVKDWQTTKPETQTLTEYLKTLRDYNHDKPEEEWKPAKQKPHIATLLKLDSDYDKLQEKQDASNSRAGYIKQRLESFRRKKKNRGDHRHHAIDATVIALSDARMLARIVQWEDRKKRDQKKRDQSFKFPLPWETFDEDVRQTIDNIIVSHRPKGRVRGAFHDQTNYGQNIPPNDQANGQKIPNEGEYVIRKELTALSANELNMIKDERVREIVLERLKKFGIDLKRKKKEEEEGDMENEEKEKAQKKWKAQLKVAFTEPLYILKKDVKIEDLPKNEREKHLIRKVRIVRKEKSVLRLREEISPNGHVFVKPGSTHHIVLFEEDTYVTKGSGKKKTATPAKKRIPVFVTRLEANKRLYKQKKLLADKRKELCLTQKQAKHDKQFIECRKQVLRKFPIIETDARKIPASCWLDGKEHPDAKFLFSLKHDETFIIKDDDEKKFAIFVSAASTSGQFRFIDIRDARKKTANISKRGSSLNDIIDKVVVDRLGQVKRCNN